MTRITCDECRFWNQREAPVPREHVGTCHRHAPMVGDSVARWPQTNASDFCGDAEVETSNEWPLELRGPVAGGHRHHE